MKGSGVRNVGNMEGKVVLDTWSSLESVYVYSVLHRDLQSQMNSDTLLPPHEWVGESWSYHVCSFYSFVSRFLPY